MKNLITALGLLACVSMSAQDISGAWKGELKAGPQSLTILFDFNPGTKSATMGVVEQGAMNIPAAVSILTSDSVNVSVPSIGAGYKARLTDGTLSGVFSQNGMEFPLNLKPGTVAFDRPQTPSAPFPYQTREVAFKGGGEGVTLSGTLVYPKNVKGKVPVVLMVTGSGPQNRDEELFEHKPFLVIADYLARQGIASLRYDDRGVAQSSGDFMSATTADLAADASAGVSYLRSLKEFSKVGVLGHSEGGMIAFMLASERKADFIVSLAGPAGNIGDLMMAQINLLTRAQGYPADIVSSPTEAEALMYQQDPRPWTEQFFKMDLTPLLPKIKCPVLALGAENDLNVPPSVNTPSLEKGLAGNRRAKIAVYPGLNHLFQHAPKGSSALAVGISETISPEVLEDIASWISELR